MGLVAIYVDPDDADIRYVVPVAEDGKVRPTVQRQKRPCPLLRVREERPGDLADDDEG